MWLPLISLLVATSTSSVFLGPQDAHSLVTNGAVVLDARGAEAEAPYVPGARVIDWKDLRDDWGRTGRVDTPKELEKAFRQAGVTAERPVLVYGAFQKGWGEEGRIWWMLRYLGHTQAYILDGGIEAWTKAKKPVASRPTVGVEPSRWIISPKFRLRADFHRVQKARAALSAHVLDTRSEEEYRGATPYWSSRGGHVPGARHFDYRQLIGSNGRLLSSDELRTRFAALGLQPEQEIITYCTGGVRSAFVVAVLMQAGFKDVANYDGSWWEWSSKDELPVAQ